MRLLKYLKLLIGFLAGSAEVALKKYVKHQTGWVKMLKNQRDNINLQSSKEHVKTYIPSNLIQYFSEKIKFIVLISPF